MPFFPVDDDFAFHAKARAAGNAAIGLWTRAGAYCMKQATDGILQRHELDGLGKPAEARRLVDVVLWHVAGHDCDACPQPPKGGWVFHEWTEHGPLKSSGQIRDYREAGKERQRRHRAKTGDGVRNGVTDAARHAVNNGGCSHSPSPSPSVVVKHVGQSGSVTRDALDGLTDEDFDDIRRRLGCASSGHARKVAGQILARAQVPVLNPLRYVLAGVDAEPDRYRPTPGPSKRADECQTHPGQPASNCGGCVVDARVGDR